MAYYDIPQRARVRLGAMPARARIRRAGLRGLGQSVGVPAGSQITYTCQFTPGVGLTTLSSVLAAITQNLSSQWNIAVTGSTTPGFLAQAASTGPFSITLQLQTMIDYNQLSDIKSILDGVWYNTGVGTITSSSIAITSLAVEGVSISQAPIGTAAVQAAAAAAAPFDFGTWLSDNWIYLAAGLIGVVVLEDLL